MKVARDLAALGGHSAEHQEMVLGLAVAAFVFVVFVLVLVYRKSGKSVEMEEIDSFLRDEDIF